MNFNCLITKSTKRSPKKTSSRVNPTNLGTQHLVEVEVQVATIATTTTVTAKRRGSSRILHLMLTNLMMQSTITSTRIVTSFKGSKVR